MIKLFFLVFSMQVQAQVQDQNLGSCATLQADGEIKDHISTQQAQVILDENFYEQYRNVASYVNLQCRNQGCFRGYDWVEATFSGNVDTGARVQGIVSFKCTNSAFPSRTIPFGTSRSLLNAWKEQQRRLEIGAFIHPRDRAEVESRNSSNTDQGSVTTGESDSVDGSN